MLFSAHASGSTTTARSKSMPSGRVWTNRSGSRMNSANAPSRSSPTSVPALLAQKSQCPRRQEGQLPQYSVGLMITRSPGLCVVTADPTASTNPTASCPITTPGSAGNLPTSTLRSVPQMPVCTTRTTTSVGAEASGFGWSTSDTVRRSFRIRAFTGFLLWWWGRRRGGPTGWRRAVPCGAGGWPPRCTTSGSSGPGRAAGWSPGRRRRRR